MMNRFPVTTAGGNDEEYHRIDIKSGEAGAQ